LGDENRDGSILRVSDIPLEDGLSSGQSPDNCSAMATAHPSDSLSHLIALSMRVFSDDFYKFPLLLGRADSGFQNG
jgi:hypothetical protein